MLLMDNKVKSFRPHPYRQERKIFIEGYFVVGIRLKIIWEKVPTEPYWETIDKLVQDMVVRELGACAGISIFSQPTSVLARSLL